MRKLFFLLIALGVLLVGCEDNKKDGNKKEYVKWEDASDSDLLGIAKDLAAVYQEVYLEDDEKRYKELSKELFVDYERYAPLHKFNAFEEYTLSFIDDNVSRKDDYFEYVFDVKGSYTKKSGNKVDFEGSMVLEIVPTDDNSYKIKEVHVQPHLDLDEFVYRYVTEELIIKIARAKIADSDEDFAKAFNDFRYRDDHIEEAKEYFEIGTYIDVDPHIIEDSVNIVELEDGKFKYAADIEMTMYNHQVEKVTTTEHWILDVQLNQHFDYEVVDLTVTPEGEIPVDENAGTDEDVPEVPDDTEEKPDDEETEEPIDDEQTQPDEEETVEEDTDELIVTELEVKHRNVKRAYTANWKEIETKLKSPYHFSWSSTAQDWQDVMKALYELSGLSSDEMVLHWLNNDGFKQFVATVSDKQQTQVYRIYLEWNDKGIWKPAKIEELKTLQPYK